MSAERPLILIADDDEDILSLIALRLERAGYEVMSVKDGQAALASARARKPAVAVLDVMMPRIGGIEVVAEFRADPDLREVSVILLSARVQEDDVQRGLAAGADRYLIKPFKFAELETEIEQLL